MSFRWLVLVVGACLLLSPIHSALARPETGPRCNDSLDNDRDGLVDSEDPDCNPPPTLEDRVTALEAIIAIHESRLAALEAGRRDFESFSSQAAAAANGWELFNGVGSWGWQNTSEAGGAAGEARADSYTAGTTRWYADVQLEQTLSFDQDWRAEGRMDFLADSASDGGMMFGFFDRNGSFTGDTLTAAGFLLVNGELTIRLERRPDVPYLDSADFGLWTNEDHTFILDYDADGGPVGYGRLTGTLVRSSDGMTISEFLDVPLTAVVGAELNSFGFYAQDVFAGRATNFDWVVDDLSYGAR